MVQNELCQGLELEEGRKNKSGFILVLKDLTAKNRKQSIPSLVPVINLNSECKAAYTIGMCTGWETFLEYFSFRSLLLCKHINASHMNSDNSIFSSWRKHMCTCMGVRSFWANSVTDLGINRAGSWMKLFSCRILVFLANQEQLGSRC